LVIFETIDKAIKFTELLKKNNKNFIPYLRSDQNLGQDALKNLQTDSIIIATNLAGRGTDFKLSKQIAENGGLHVVLTFSASNLRVEQQAFGRAARTGQFGTGRLVLHSADNPFLLNCVYSRLEDYFTVSAIA
jgi:preprotein translocase subunit SecA